MKIIGRNNDGFILDATGNEIARLIGYYDDGQCHILKVGDVINVNEMYLQLYRIAKNKERLDELAKELEKYAGYFRQIQPVINSNL